jgi:hypothetical protein
MGSISSLQSDHDGKTQIWAIPEKDGLFRKATRVPTQLTTGPLSYSRAVPSVDGKRIFAIGSQPRGELVRFFLRGGVRASVGAEIDGVETC